MVDNLLNVSRIQSGKAILKIEVTNLAYVLIEQLDLIKESSDIHRFVLNLAPDLPDALIDRDKFGHVIGNLLSNAVKYSPGGGTVTLSAHRDEKRHRIIVSVADEGMGISPTDQLSLFTTFNRIQRPETRGIAGSGLGLYIAKEWTEAMGGEIWLKSELNKGTTFFVSIPERNSNA
jgi:two-component system sensor histidine kinase VicK